MISFNQAYNPKLGEIVMKKALALLACLTLLFAAGCGNTSDTTSSGVSSATSGELAYPVTLHADGKTDFQLVYALKDPLGEKALATSLADAFKTKASVTTKPISDRKLEGKTILVGRTAAAQSATALDKLNKAGGIASDDYIIALIDGAIVINAVGPSGLQKAVDYFADNCIANGKLEKEIISTSGATAVKVGAADDISVFTIAADTITSRSNIVKAATKLQNALLEKAGRYVALSTEGEYTINFTFTTDNATGKYTIDVKDKVIDIKVASLMAADAAAAKIADAVAAGTAIANGTALSGDCTPKADKYVVFAIDDAPSELMTRFVDKFSEYGGRCAFMLIGNKITDSSKGMLQYAVDNGCQLGTHTETHPYMTKLTEDEMKAELNGPIKKVKDLIGYDITIARLPYFDRNATVLGVMTELKLPSLGTVSYTKENPLDQVALMDGDIICIHVTESDLALMDTLLPDLAANGYGFVTFDRMYEIKGTTAPLGVQINNANQR